MYHVTTNASSSNNSSKPKRTQSSHPSPAHRQTQTDRHTDTQIHRCTEKETLKVTQLGAHEDRDCMRWRRPFCFCEFPSFTDVGEGRRAEEAAAAVSSFLSSVRLSESAGKNLSAKYTNPAPNRNPTAAGKNASCAIAKPNNQPPSKQASKQASKKESKTTCV